MQILCRYLSCCLKITLLSSAMFLSAFPYSSQLALVVKNLRANARDIEIWLRALGWKDPLEEGMATHSTILAWQIPWIEEPGRIQSMGSQKVKHD